MMLLGSPLGGFKGRKARERKQGDNLLMPASHVRREGVVRSTYGFGPAWLLWSRAVEGYCKAMPARAARPKRRDLEFAQPSSENTGI